MKPDHDYPRMMFHPHQPPVTVKSREEETALGEEWSRIIHPPGAVSPRPQAAPAPLPPVPEPKLEPELAEEPEETPEPEPEPDMREGMARRMAKVGADAYNAPAKHAAKKKSAKKRR